MICGRAITLLLPILLLSGLSAFAELPRLPEGLDPKLQNNKAQEKLPNLAEAYVSISPKDLGDGLKVGTLNQPGAEEAVKALIEDDKEVKYSNLDSLLIWKDGELIFEMYNRKGRVDAPHYMMSVTKTLTSVTLARAIQLDFLKMDDLDKPVLHFMPKIDKSKVKPGVDTITLREVLFMKSGLRFENRSATSTSAFKGQDYFQHLFENTAPVTPESKEYKYTGTDPSIIMMAIDIRAKKKGFSGVQEFIKTELAEKFGVSYCWPDQECGIPKCGAGSNFTSRSLVKFATSIVQGGKYNGEQLLSADYIKLVMAPKEEEGYYYYFHNRTKSVADKKVKFISGIGAGGQYMATFPEQNVIAVATATNKMKGGIGKPLNAVLEHLMPLFVE